MAGAKQAEVMMNPVKHFKEDLSLSRFTTKEDKNTPSFSSVLADESKDEVYKEIKPKDKNENKQETKKEVRAKEEIKRLLEAKLAGKISDLSPMYQFLYYFIYKDPATLSMAERQSINPRLIANNSFASNGATGLGIAEFHKLLSSYGVKVSDFSFSQITDLIRMNSKAEVTGFLERFRMEMQKNEYETYNVLENEENAEKYKYSVRQDPVILAIEEHRFSLDKEKRTQIQAAENVLDKGAGSGTNSNVKFNTGSVNEARVMEQPYDLSPEEFITQILDVIAGKSPEELSKVVIKLYPEHLGSLQLTVGLDRKNRMEAHFEAETEKAKNLIETNVYELEKALCRQGVTVNKIKVVKKSLKRGVGA